MIKSGSSAELPLSSSSLPAAAKSILKRLFREKEIKKVLLVNPPDSDSSMFRYATAKRGRYTNYPPYGLAVLAQHLKTMGIEVRISNLNHEILKRCAESPSEQEFVFDVVWQGKLDQDLQGFQPDLIGITCMFTMTHSSFRSVCAWAANYGIPLAIGGVHVTNDVERVLDDIPAAHIAFLREGDVALTKLVQIVNGVREADELAQVILNDNGVRYRFLNECIPSSEDISVIPAFDLLDLAEHSRYGTVGSFYFLKVAGTRFATVLSTRGCRAQCTFCSVRNFNGPGVRLREISSVVDELELLQNEHGVGHIMWLDDDLLKDHKRIIKLFNEMVKRRLSLTWDATNGVIASSCTDEIIHAAAESGCIALNIGMESGNPAILRQIKKPGTVDTFVRAAEVLKKYEKIHSSVFLMVGFPNETMSMVFDTINLARQMDLDWHRITQLQPLPNTPIYDAMVAQGIIQDLGSKELRFMGGAYGKQTEIEQGLRLTSSNFHQAFSSIPLHAVPTPEQLTDVWFYMNYHLNFHRLFSEKRPIKIAQQMKNLSSLCDIISPENGFALYFIGYLQHRTMAGIDPSIVERLRKRLATSSYWQDRLEAFGLSIDDLIRGDFGIRPACKLMPGVRERA